MYKSTLFDELGSCNGKRLKSLF